MRLGVMGKVGGGVDLKSVSRQGAAIKWGDTISICWSNQPHGRRINVDDDDSSRERESPPGYSDSVWWV